MPACPSQDFDQSGSLTVVENTVDGYNKRDTQKMPKPIDATRAAAGFGISADAISDAQPFALNSKVRHPRCPRPPRITACLLLALHVSAMAFPDRRRWKWSIA